MLSYISHKCSTYLKSYTYSWVARQVAKKVAWYMIAYLLIA